MDATSRAGWLLALLALATSSARGQEHVRHVADCRLTWESPSAGPAEAMPLPGTRGASAWVRFADGALRIRPMHAGAITEDEHYGSLGAVRLAPEGLDLAKPRSFRQTLLPDEGALVAEVVAADGTKVSWRLWFGAETLVVETRLSRPLPLAVAFGHARVNPALRGDDRVDVVDGALLYAHRNAGARRTRQLAGEQGQDAGKLAPAVATRAYGLAVAGATRAAWRPPMPASVDGAPGHEWAGSWPASAEHVVTLTLGAATGLLPEELARRGNTVAGPEVLPSVRLAAEQRWEDFWARGGIFPNPNADAADPVRQLGRNHALARFLMASNQGAELPPRLALPAVEPTPDRQVRAEWSGQGLRMLGWAALGAGDEDLLTPVLRLYRDRLGPAQARAKLAKAEGALFPEALTLAGLSPIPTAPDGMPRDPLPSRQHTSPVEFAWMAARARLELGRDLRADLPWILDAVRGVTSLHTPKPVAAKPAKGEKPAATAPATLAFEPASALGLCPGATNPADLVAALRALLPALAASDQVAEKDRTSLAELARRLPELPVAEKGGAEVLLPAAKAPRFLVSADLPEFHAAWPFGLVGVANPAGLELAQATWANLAGPAAGQRPSPASSRSSALRQAPLPLLAALGRTDDAGNLALARFSDAASPGRLPLQRGAGTDLAVLAEGMAGLHAMLIASEPDPKGRIFLLPAWPRKWDVTFRVRAPGSTVVDGTVEGGKLTRLVTAPVERRDDIVLPEGWSVPPR